MAALPIVAVGASVLSAGIGAFGAIQSSQAQSAAASYQAQVAANNATIAQQNATYATQAGNAQASNQQIANAQKEGQIKAALGASGLDVNQGSAFRTQVGQQETDALDVENIRNNAARQAYGYQSQASGYQAQAGLDTMTAQQASAAGPLSAAGSLLSGASSTALTAQKFGLIGGSSNPSLSLSN
jgi:hypothetical protein